MVWAYIVNLLLPVTTIVDSNCNYSQEMVIGQQYYIYNMEYPSTYPPLTSCKWFARGPPNSKIVLSCTEVNIPSTPNCEYDRIAISLNGEENLDGAENFCGNGNISLVSEKNKLAIGLFSSYYGGAGKFFCTITAIAEELDIAKPTTTTPRPNSCDCGWRNYRRIVGGIQTGINEYPFMAGIIDLVARTLWCGGVIISRRFALTAAHCMERKRAREFGLLVGDHDLSMGNEAPSVALYVLDSIKIHFAYNNSTFENDIALVKTQNRMVFNSDVGPVCLPFRYTDLDTNGFLATLLGWGTTEFSGSKSDVLMAANVTIVNNFDCQQKLPKDKVTPGSLCTYAYGRDACQFDSGGPVIWFDWISRRFNVLGLISHGIGCASDFPAVNTRVTAYLSWIVRQTKGSFCIK